MKQFHETLRDELTNIDFIRQPNPRFALHYHSNMEIFLLEKGHYSICMNNARHEVYDHSIVVIDSYSPHSYDTQNKPEQYISYDLFIPPDYLHLFNKLRNNSKISQPIIRDKAFFYEFLSLIKTYLLPEERMRTKQHAIDFMLALLWDKLSFSAKENSYIDQDLLIKKIINFVEVNFKKDITRSSISRALGYTESYVSHTFHRYMNTSISNYINNCRLNYIDQQRKAGDKRSILTLLYEAGFSSSQTYYRSKQKLQTENNFDKIKTMTCKF